MKQQQVLLTLDSLPSSKSVAKQEGSLYYYTGVPCKNGHLSERFTAHSNCRQCLTEKTSKWQKSNRDVIVERTRTWQNNNRTKMRKASNNWKKNNKDKWYAYMAYRRASKLQAVPKWADSEIIKDMYTEASYMQMEVDHIVPLISPLVCGLHVEHNLQLLTPLANATKGNRSWPDMPTF